MAIVKLLKIIRYYFFYTLLKIFCSESIEIKKNDRIYINKPKNDYILFTFFEVFDVCMPTIKEYKKRFKIK